MAVFEQFVYAWSPRGLEGTNRYQVAAATGRIAEVFRRRHPLLSAAEQLSGWTTAPDDQVGDVIGWRIQQELGMLAWVKRRVPKDHWAGVGGHIVHMFHTPRRPDLHQLFTLFDAAYLAATENEAYSSTELPPIPKYDPKQNVVDFDPDESDIDLASLVIAIGLNRNGSGRCGIITHNDALVRAMKLCAQHCPLPVLTSRNFTTSAPLDQTANYALCGIGPTPAAPAITIDVVTTESIPTDTLTAARAAITDDQTASAFTMARAEVGTMNTELFEAAVLFLSGNSEQLSIAQASALLDDPSATKIALERKASRQQLIQLAFGFPRELGSRLANGAAANPRLYDIADDIAAAVCRGLDSPAKLDIINEPNELFSAVMDALSATVCTNGADSVRKLNVRPVIAAELAARTSASSVPSRKIMAYRDHPNRELVHAALLDRLERSNGPQTFLHRINPGDLIELLGRWWRAPSSPWPSVDEALLSAQRSNLLYRFAELIDTSDDVVRLDDWLQRQPARSELSCAVVATFLAHAQAGHAFVWAMQHLNLVQSQSAVRWIAARCDDVFLRQLGDCTNEVAAPAALAVETDLLNALRAGRRPMPSSDHLAITRSFADRDLMAWSLWQACHSHRRLSAAHEQRLSAPHFVEIIDAAVSTYTTTASRALLLDAAIPTVVDGDNLARVVGHMIARCERDPVETWLEVLGVADRLQASSPWAAAHYRHKVTEAVTSAVKAGHFGRKVRLLGTPKPLQEHLERWRTRVD